MNDKKRDEHLPGEEEEERIGDEAELDNFDDEELEPSACPICRQDYCSEHLVANQDSGWPGITGAISDSWDEARGCAIGILRDAYLVGEPCNSPASELNAMLELLKRGADDRTEDAFDEACANQGIEGEVDSLLLEWLCRLPEVVMRYYQTDTAPGLSSSGYNYYAPDPKATTQRWHDSVMRHLHG